jgi:hypothetical protein
MSVKYHTTNAVVYSRLLHYGFIPETVDALFSSSEYADFVQKNDSLLNIDLKKITLELFSFKLTRNNNSPRLLGIIHPYAYVNLARTITTSWPDLMKIVINNKKDKSFKPMSIIKPTLSSTNGRIVNLYSDPYSYEMKDRDNFKNEIKLINSKLNATILVKADISNCYHSIYIHSVSWTAKGRIAAFTERAEKYWNNKLEKALMFCQSSESIGLPIGPDTSAVIAEYILSAVDRELKKFSYIRYIDDYRCYCSSVEEAEEFIISLSNALEKNRLYLNTKKTEILKLPQATNSSWVTSLRILNLSLPKTIDDKNVSVVENFLNLTVDLSKNYPQESPLKYALKILVDRHFTDANSYLNICKYVLHLTILHPYILESSEKFINIGYKNFSKSKTELDILVENFIVELVKIHAPYKRSDALTWAMAIAIKYKIKLSIKIIKKIVKASDSASSLFAYLYCNQNYITGKIVFPKRNSDTSWWLYSYEINRINKKKFKIKNRKDFDFLNTMLKNNVSFINQDFFTNSSIEPILKVSF